MKFLQLLGLTLITACASSPPLTSPEAPTPPTDSASPLAGTIPCFPTRITPISGSEAASALKRFSHLFDDGEPGTWGACTVADGKVVEPGGRQVAAVHCGIEFLVPGFVDSYGLTIGVLGSEVREHAGADRDVYCVSNGPAQTRCTLVAANQVEDEDVYESNQYMVAGELPSDVLRSEAAWNWFADRTVISIVENMYCH